MNDLFTSTVDIASEWWLRWHVVENLEQFLFLHSSSMQILPASTPTKYIYHILLKHHWESPEFSKGASKLLRNSREKSDSWALSTASEITKATRNKAWYGLSLASGDFIQVAASNWRRLMKEERSSPSRRTKVHQRCFKLFSNHITQYQSR